MPRPGPRKVLVAVRLTQEQVDKVDAEAERRDVNRSEAIRDLIDALGASPKQRWDST